MGSETEKVGDIEEQPLVGESSPLLEKEKVGDTEQQPVEEPLVPPPSQDQQSKRVMSTKEKHVNVHNFFMMKHIKDDDDGLIVVGTFIQHVFAGENEEVQNLGKLEFEYRFNDESADSDTGYVKRRRTEKHETDLGTCYRHTYQVRAPLELEVELDYFPFKVISAKLLVELSTPTTDDEALRLRPNLMIHNEDKCNVFSIQKALLKDSDAPPEQQAADKLDKTENYDFISPFPTITYMYEKNKYYTPKVEMKFRMVENGMKKFAEIVFPMFLIAVMNTIQVINPEDVEISDYIANSATFALSVVVLLPNMIGESRIQKLWTSNNLYIMMIFVGLSLSSIPAHWVDTSIPALLGMILYWVSFLFLIYNGWRYVTFLNEIKEGSGNPKHFWPPTPPTGPKPYNVAKAKSSKKVLETVEAVTKWGSAKQKEKEFVVKETNKFMLVSFAPLGKSIVET